jgi:RNA polymerase sigma-70 factor (ECF subfamily)
LRVTEQNVVQQIKYKNEDSISYVLQSYGGLLNTIIRKYLQGNQQDIEECLADVLVSIWFHINSFDSTKNEFKQWIAAIAKYRAIDYVRRSEKSKQYISKFELEEASSQSISKQSEFDITYLFNKLNSTERSIFEKYYVEGVSSKEIANEFQAKESWVHNKLSRGRKKLKTILQKGEV